MARVANHEIGVHAKLRADRARGQQRLQRGIDADGTVATPRRRDRPSAPVAADVDERAAAAFLERDVGNRILRQASDERPVEVAAGAANGFLDERVDAFARRGATGVSRATLRDPTGSADADPVGRRGGGASVPTAPPQAVTSAFALVVFFALVPVVVDFFAALAAVSAVLRCAAVCAPNFFVNRSTRPSVSISFWRPVKNGWHAEQISRCSSGLVERVLKVLPQAQRTSTSLYFGWIPSFTVTSPGMMNKSLYRHSNSFKGFRGS